MGHKTRTVPADIWTLLTTSGTVDGTGIATAVAAARVVPISGFGVKLQATVANVAPTSDGGHQPLPLNATLEETIPLVNLFRGVGLGPYYLWALSQVSCSVSVSFND